MAFYRHQIKYYAAFAEFLIDQYTEHGVNAALLLKNKMAELKTSDADLAYEEMIADACETMLLDSNAAVKLMELRKSDLELFEKIKLHIHKILSEIRNFYKSMGYGPSSDEAKALIGMKDVLEKIYSMFEDAAVDAAQNYQALGTEGYNEQLGSDGADVKRQVKSFDSSKEKIKQNLQAVAQMTSVCNVSNSKLQKTGKKPFEIFESYFQEWGNCLQSDELGDIAVGKSSVRSEVRHGITAEKIASIEAIPAVIKEGKVIFVGQKSESGLQRIVVCAPITIGNTSYYMGVMLQRDIKTQRLYLHNVAIEKETSEFSQDNLLTTGSHESDERLFITSILQDALFVKYQNNKKGVDYDSIKSDSIKKQLKKTSNREILANALESVAKNDIERKKLSEYREKAAAIEAEQEKLSTLRAEIKELSFAKGKRDTERINELRQKQIIICPVLRQKSR